MMPPLRFEPMPTSLDDDYTRYLRKREMQEQDMSIDSRLYGVGVQIAETQRQDYCDYAHLGDPRRRRLAPGLAM